MLGRIQKKLYLSAKVTETMRDIHFNAQNKKGKKTSDIGVMEADEMPQLGTNELLSLVRRGAQTLAHPEIDVNEMLSWDWQTTLAKCKDQPGDAHSSKDNAKTGETKGEDEQRWLAQIEQVKSRVFQGKEIRKANKNDKYLDPRQEWAREDRRQGKNTTVMVGGYAVSKESMTCGDWEAVPTLAGKDPRLAEPKRDKKAAVNNQDYCQSCFDGGEITLCGLCPRSYHHDCLDPDAQARAKSSRAFSCPQHQCVDCSQKTTEAGGMLFRCRTCERAFCEDCLDF